MAELEELERRLSEALQRIALAHSAVENSTADGAAELAALREENAVLTAKITDLEMTSGDAPEGADPEALATLEAELAEAAETRAALEDALEGERREREAQAETLAEAIAEQGRLVESRDAAEALREELEERAQRFSERETLKTAEARSEVDDLRGRIDALEASADKLREANRQLRSNNAALREAHAAGLPDADLINGGLQAELDALVAVRAADRAELDGVLAALRPMLEEAADA
ncbi:MAG: hypothetical protein OIF40_04820 [Mangrovicoccus sp.]|nr:hypothetical protein [Mangrovicoccus sp.]